MTDELDRTVKDVEAWAAARNLPVVRGTLESNDALATVACDPGVGAADFLERLAAAGAWMLVLDVVRLEKDELEETIEYVESLSRRDATRAVLPELVKCRLHVGHVREFNVSGILRGAPVAIEWSAAAPWNAIVDPPDDEDDDDDEDED